MPLSPEPPPAAPTCHVLGFDTSTERLAVALAGPGGPWTLVAEGGAAASAQLLPQTQALLARASLAYADLDFIAFGRGPGAFTGLRTACAVAQGIAFGIDKPVLPIDSLLIVAEDARAQLPACDDMDIAVAMDARMDEVYAARYRWHAGRWLVLQAPALYSLPALPAVWADATLQAVAGSALAAFGDRVTWPPDAQRVPQEHDRAGALLRLALVAAAAGEGIDAAQALPLYLRDKVALTTQERDAARAAKAAAGA